MTFEFILELLGLLAAHSLWVLSSWATAALLLLRIAGSTGSRASHAASQPLERMEAAAGVLPAAGDAAAAGDEAEAGDIQQAQHSTQLRQAASRQHSKSLSKHHAGKQRNLSNER